MAAIRSHAQLPLLAPETAWEAPQELPSLRGVKRLAFDVETRDEQLKTLGPGVRRGGYVVGMAIGTDDGRRCYLPMRHEGGGNIDSDFVWAWARAELNAFDGELVGANLLYDLDYSAEQGVTFPRVRRFYDVQVAEPLLDEHKVGEYNLEALARLYLKETKREQLLSEAAVAYGFGNTSTEIKSNLWRLPAKYVGAYGEGDADLPLRILPLQLEKLEKEGLLPLFDLESRLIPVLLAMRRRGVRVDVGRAEQVRARLVLERDQALAKLRQFAGPKAELMAAESFANALKDRGLQFPLTANTKKPSITQSWLKANAGDPMVDSILDGRRVATIINTFVDGHILTHAVNGRIHCQFNQLKGDDSGTIARLCVAGDTPVMVPGGWKIIRDIRVGDLVYSYDTDQKLKLGRVSWSGKTGTKPVFKLLFTKGYKQKTLSILITQDHLVRLIDGSYRQVKDLKPGDHVMALSRQTDRNYKRLNIFGITKSKSEHRTVFMLKHGYLPDHVHHENGVGWDNHPDNLEGLTISEHVRHHMTTEEASRRVKLAHSRSNAIREGAAHGHARAVEKRLTREKLEELTNAGKPISVIADLLHSSKSSVKRRMQELDIKPCNVSARFQESLRRSPIVRIQELQSEGLTIRKILSQMNNHVVLWVEAAGIEDVYDIEVEEYHNFIANEICIHNSCQNPNMQNLPARDDELGPLIRSLFVPEEGQDWASCDECLTGDTVVVTIGGPKTILELMENPVPILSSPDCQRVEFKPVTAIWFSGIRPVFKITFEDGSTVRCTDNHRWMSHHNEEIYTRDLRPGMQLAHVKDGVCAKDIPTYNHRVVSIEPDGESAVYDITVADNHTFVLTNGLVSHNSQAEFRLLTHYAIGDRAEDARNQYRNDPTTDFHSMCAHMMHLDMHGKGGRTKVKSVNFCRVYGGGIPKIAAMLGCSIAEATTFVDQYDRELPFIKKTSELAMRVAQQRGYVVTIYGRRQRFQLWEPPDNYARIHQALPHAEALERYGTRIVRAFAHAALNRVLQGSAADQLKRAIVDIYESGVNHVLGPILITVHDENNFSVPRTPEGQEAIQEAKHLMEIAIPLKVPMVANLKTGENWGACQ